MSDIKKQYTYLIGWSKHQKYYYGVRISDSVASPNHDLWRTYKTSSKEVKKMVKLHGDPDVIQVRRVFSETEQALKWERKVLKRMDVSKNPKFLNKKSGANHGLSFTRLPEVRAKLAKTNIEKYGTPYTTQLDVVSNAREAACLEKFGTANPVYSEKFQERVRELQKTPEYRQKVSQGVKRAWKNYDFSERDQKIKNTNLERYGTKCSMNRPELIHQRTMFILNCPYSCSKRGGQLLREKQKDVPLIYHWKMNGFITHMVHCHGLTKSEARKMFETHKQELGLFIKNEHVDIKLETVGLS